MIISKRDWVLLLLRASPLDRIRLMKALFLLWYRSNKHIPEYFDFQPYLYGPCSFEVYSVLDEISKQGLVVQPPHPVHQWANYYLTERGRAAAKEAAQKVDPDTAMKIEQVAQEVSRLGFYELLKKVYNEAPEFAVNSVLRGLIQ